LLVRVVDPSVLVPHQCLPQLAALVEPVPPLRNGWNVSTVETWLGCYRVDGMYEMGQPP
jgi:hypothetical protein